MPASAPAARRRVEPFPAESLLKFFCIRLEPKAEYVVPLIVLHDRVPPWGDRKSLAEVVDEVVVAAPQNLAGNDDLLRVKTIQLASAQAGFDHALDSLFTFCSYN